MEPKWIVLGVAVIVAMNIAVTTVVYNVHSGSDITSPQAVIPKNAGSLADEIKDFINPENIRKHLRAVTKKGHVSGTENNYEVAKYIRNEMISQGLESVHFNEYDVLLSYPNWTIPNTVEILGEDGSTLYKTKGRSPVIIKEEQTDPEVDLHWLAYSANGMVEGDIVYVNGASEQDFQHLIRLGIELKGKIFLARYGTTFRGNIAQRAMKYGAVGCIIYSDPIQVASWGTGPNETYSSTDKMPPNAVQRGTMLLGFGDPRTPAFPSIKGLHREKTEEQLYEEERISTIPVLPIPYNDAQVVFENMKGEAVVPAWQGKLPVTYRYGPGLISNQKIRVTVHAKNEERTIRNVLGYIKGDLEPEKLVILSNHYDAWTYGAVDPNSGTSTLLETSRALKAYSNRTGWRPARTILFAHWDTEEYGLMGSSEFAEEFRDQLMNRAVVMLNMDAVAGNRSLYALASPTIAHVLRDAAAETEQPNRDELSEGRSTMLETWKHYTPAKNNRRIPYCGLPAAGSDQAAFFDYLGVPMIYFITVPVDPYWVFPLYHTIYETPFLVEKIMDPEFKMISAVAELFIRMALEFTEAEILPYDLGAFMDDVQGVYLPELSGSFEEVQKFGNVSEYLIPGLEQLDFLIEITKNVSIQVNQRNLTALEKLPLLRRIDVNRRLVEFEKCFINPQGLSPEAPEARHVLYHPSSADWYKGGVMQQVHNGSENEFLLPRVFSGFGEKPNYVSKSHNPLSTIGVQQAVMAIAQLIFTIISVLCLLYDLLLLISVIKARTSHNKSHPFVYIVFMSVVGIIGKISYVLLLDAWPLALLLFTDKWYEEYRQLVGKQETLLGTFCYLTPICLNFLMTIHRVWVVWSPFDTGTFSESRLVVYCSAVTMTVFSSLLIPYYSACSLNFDGRILSFVSACAPERHPITTFQNKNTLWLPMIAMLINFAIILRMRSRRIHEAGLHSSTLPSISAVCQKSREHVMLRQTAFIATYISFYELGSLFIRLYPKEYGNLPKGFHNAFYFFRLSSMSSLNFFVYFLQTKSTRLMVLQFLGFRKVLPALTTVVSITKHKL